MSKKYKKNMQVFKLCFGHLLILVSIVTGCVSISAFASLVCVPTGITSSAVKIKICEIIAGIKSIIKKKK